MPAAFVLLKCFDYNYNVVRVCTVARFIVHVVGQNTIKLQSLYTPKSWVEIKKGELSLVILSMHACTCVCVYVCMYACACAYSYLCMCMFAYVQGIGGSSSELKVESTSKLCVLASVLYTYNYTQF